MRSKQNSVLVTLILILNATGTSAFAEEPAEQNGGFVEIRGQAVRQTDSDRNAVGGSVAVGYDARGTKMSNYGSGPGDSLHLAGSIGFSGQRLIGGAEVSGTLGACGYGRNDCGVGAYLALSSDFSDRMSEVVKGTAGYMAGDAHNHLVLGAHLGALWDRETGYAGFIAGPSILGRVRAGSLLTLEGGLEGGIIAGGKSFDSKKTTEDTRVQGDSKSPTENVHTSIGAVTDRETLTAPGMQMDGVGNYEKFKARARVRLGEHSPLYVQAAASVARTDIKYKDEFLNDATGDSHHIQNIELFGGIAAGGVF